MTRPTQPFRRSLAPRVLFAVFGLPGLLSCASSHEIEEQRQQQERERQAGARSEEASAFFSRIPITPGTNLNEPNLVEQIVGPTRMSQFGAQVALSADGSTLATTGTLRGGVVVFSLENGRWTHATSISAYPAGDGGQTPCRVRLSRDGSRVLIGNDVFGERGDGILGDVRVFVRDDRNYKLEHVFDEDEVHRFAELIDIDADGRRVVMMKRHAEVRGGAFRVYDRTDDRWTLTHEETRLDVDADHIELASDGLSFVASVWNASPERVSPGAGIYLFRQGADAWPKRELARRQAYEVFPLCQGAVADFVAEGREVVMQMSCQGTDHMYSAFARFDVLGGLDGAEISIQKNLVPGIEIDPSHTFTSLLVASSADGNRLVTANRATHAINSDFVPKVTVWDRRDGAWTESHRIRNFPTPVVGLYALALSADGKLLVLSDASEPHLDSVREGVYPTRVPDRSGLILVMSLPR